MKKIFLFYLVITCVIFSFSSCNDPIFFAVSQEDPPLSPLIGGSPARLIIINDELFTASGRNLWRLKLNSPSYEEWKRFRNDSWIWDITEVEGVLYICYESGNNAGISKVDSLDEDENKIISTVVNTLNNNVQTLFSADNMLYYSARNSNGSSSIYAGSDPNTPILENVAELRGAASRNTYTFLCTGGLIRSADSPITGGIYLLNEGIDKIPVEIPGLELPVTDIDFRGIINLQDINNTIVAIDRSGFLYEVTQSVVKRLNTPNTPNTNEFMLGGRTSGALAVWTDIDSRRLLLVGRQDTNTSLNTGSTHGYRELVLDPVTGGLGDDKIFYWPGRNTDSRPTTLLENSRYVSSIGKLGINHLIQADGILFASTQQNGVWSLRDRGELHVHWNAEQQPPNPDSP